MDLVLNKADEIFLTPYVYSPTFLPNDIRRQTLSIYGITLVGGYLLYFIIASLSYWILFDKRLLSHPKILPNQIQKEIFVAFRSIPFMVLYTLPIFLGEVRGYSQLYDSIEEYGWSYLWMSIGLFLFFNDMLIYWIHRGLHHPLLYKRIHKTHHRWLVPTPFASHAFEPLDGFLQSLPYHIFVYICPLHKVIYLVLFVLVNFWTISIHDEYYAVPSMLKSIINGAAHHTDHHLYYNYNYGQYFTLWDRIGGSYRDPSPWQGKGPLDDVLQMKAKDA